MKTRKTHTRPAGAGTAVFPATAASGSPGPARSGCSGATRRCRRACAAARPRPWTTGSRSAGSTSWTQSEGEASVRCTHSVSVRGCRNVVTRCKILTFRDPLKMIIFDEKLSQSLLTVPGISSKNRKVQKFPAKEMYWMSRAAPIPRAERV